MVAWTCLALAGCFASNQTGPYKPFSIEYDVQSVANLAEPDWYYYRSLSEPQQALYRNNIITARMYIADLQYHYYEANLTKEMQEEGLLATAANLGLTGTASLIPVAQTTRLLAGIATGVTGLDKAYNEKELLSNTMQALQTQMRADRKDQAAAIFAKMLKDANNNTKTATPIAEYTLPMALSDTDAYYQAGTIASALVGLSKTVANADRNADTAKAQAGPNPTQVAAAKETAAPRSPPLSGLPAAPVIRAAFGADTCSAVLRGFLYDTPGHLIPTSKDAITPFFTSIGLRVPRDIGAFLNEAKYAAERQTLVNALKLQGGCKP